MPRDVAALVALIDEFSDPLRFDITEFRLFMEARKISPIFEHIIEHFCSELFRFSKSDTNLMVIQRNFPIQSNRWYFSSAMGLIANRNASLSHQFASPPWADFKIDPANLIG